MMTVEQQQTCFDCTVKELDELIASWQGRDLNMVVMSMLSDVQEMVESGLEKETVRRTLNRAKYILDTASRSNRS